MVSVNEKLQEVLTWSGVSQYELARRADVHPNSISSYVTGKTAISIALLFKFAEALGVSPWLFLNGEPLPVTSEDLTEKERRMVALYRNLTVREQAAVEVMLDKLGER